MQKTLREIAEFIGAEISGDKETVITGVCGIKEASPGDIAFLANPKYIPCLDSTRASAIIVSRDITSQNKTLLKVDNPSLAFTKVVSLFSLDIAKHPKGIHATAVIGNNARLGSGVAIGPYAVIEDDVVLGDNVIIYSGCFIGCKAKIGSDTLIYSHACIRELVSVGSRVVIQSGVVIGSDGFGFISIDGRKQRIPQTGTVVIEDDVEIGANTCIDRARFDKTIIGKGTKIDNLVHIAHNVAIGQNSTIVAQVGISGSTVIGNNVILAGQAGVAGHIKIGDNVIVAGKAGVTKSIAPNALVSGYPAKPHDKALRVNACMQSLPKLYATVNQLKKKIEELEEKIKKG